MIRDWKENLSNYGTWRGSKMIVVTAQEWLLFLDGMDMGKTENAVKQHLHSVWLVVFGICVEKKEWM